MTGPIDLAAELAVRPRRLADLADAITLPRYDQRSFNLDWKANRTEVTEADREAETAIADAVLDAPTRRTGCSARSTAWSATRRFAVALGHRPHRRHLATSSAASPCGRR